MLGKARKNIWVSPNTVTVLVVKATNMHTVVIMLVVSTTGFGDVSKTQQRPLCEQIILSYD
jgi:hypothetical protein